MPDGFPYLVAGNSVAGQALPTRGVRFGAGIDAFAGQSALIRYAQAAPAAVTGHEALLTEGYLDGSLASEAAHDDRVIEIGGLRPGATHSIQLLPTSAGENGRSPNGADWLSANVFGDRVCLQWTDKPAQGDFESYLIYWDEGDGMDADVLLDTITDKNQLEFRSDALAAGTYKFAIAYKDRLGNESTTGSAVAVTIHPVPLAPENLEISYSSSTRKATLTWSAPSSQVSGVRTAVVFDNHCVGVVPLGPYVNSDLAYCRAVLDMPATSWVSMNLWEGEDEDGAWRSWKFGVAYLLCDSAGARLSPITTADLGLALSGSTLSETSAPPPIPLIERVEPIAGAKYKTEWRVDSEANVTAFDIIQDGSVEDTVAADGSLSYSNESGAQSDGTTYAIRVRARNGATAAADSDTINVTVDGSAPTGDKVITGSLCQ